MENIDNKSYIERLEIKGLWGRFDVNWDLHPDVNILVGENGTGKSTILSILKALSDDNVKFQKNISSNRINLYYRFEGESKQMEFRIKPHFGRNNEDELMLSTRHVREFPFYYINTFDKDLFEKNEWDKKINHL